MKSNESEQNWKLKYFDSLDELENKEKQWLSIEGLLKNSAIKMSLALDGIDYSFDKTLNELRKVFRSEATSYQIQKTIHSLNFGLDSIANKKKSSNDLHSNVWQHLLALVKSLKVPKKFKKQHKVLTKTLLKCDETMDLEPILASLQKLLMDVLDEESQSSDVTISAEVESKRSLIGKLFSKSEQKDSTAQSENRAVTKSGARLDEGLDKGLDKVLVDRNEENLPGKDELQKEYLNTSATSLVSIQSGIDVVNLLVHKLDFDKTNKASIDSYSERTRGVSDGQQLLTLVGQFIATLNHLWLGKTTSGGLSLNQAMIILLDKISLPVKLNKQISKLQSILEHDIDDKDWPILLDKIAKLVSQVRESVQKEKKELEQYLEGLTKRLLVIDNSIQSVDSDRIELHKESLILNKSVSAEVADIRNQIKSNSEIEPLKVAIEDRLDAIVTHMDSFKKHEERRNTNAERAIEELTEQLELLELESSELKGKVVKQRELAMIDRLTNIPNRMAYDERMSQEYRRWRRFNEPLCLVIIDIDLFKLVNDNYGHLAGDKVLTKVAQVINARVRETDFLSRYGGEEFVLLMTGAKLEAALKVANEIREVVNDCGFHFRDQEVKVTVSAGVAEFQGNDTPDNVFERADKALYRAKDAGRNKCST